MKLFSDHALLIADMHVRFASKHSKKQRRGSAPKFRDPAAVKLLVTTSDALVPSSFLLLPVRHLLLLYNALVHTKICSAKCRGEWDAMTAFDTLARDLIDAGNATLPSRPSAQKKTYLSAETWQNILDKQLREGHFERLTGIRYYHISCSPR